MFHSQFFVSFSLLLLFLIYIHYIDDSAIRLDILKKFADDTQMGQIMETQEDRDKLQRSLDKLCNRALTWGNGVQRKEM